MSFVTDTGSVVTMPGFEDSTPMNQIDGFSNLISDFLDDRDSSQG